MPTPRSLSLIFSLSLSCIGPVALAQERAAFMEPPRPRVAGLMRIANQALQAGADDRFRDPAVLLGPLGADLVIWQYLREGSEIDPARAAAFLTARPDWPETRQIQRRAEARLVEMEAGAAALTAFFGERRPQSVAGRVALALARSDGESLAVEIWRNDPLTATQEAQLLARYGAALTPLTEARAEEMLWQSETASAERLIPSLSAGPAALARARVALQARREGVTALIAAVPDALATDPGLAYDRFRYRLSGGDLAGAAEILAAREAGSLGRPEAWATGRIRLVREAIQQGQNAQAYRMASQHGLSDGAQMVDLEWLAGFVALRRLDQADTAHRHFARLRERVSSPISLSRGGYWEGLALEALGRAEEARAAFAFAAQHQTAFYGQLAAERLGLEFDASLIDPPPLPNWRDTSLRDNDLLAAALFLHDAGHWYDARRFVLALAQQLETREELGALANLWLERGVPNYAVNIAKIAVGRGIVLMPAYFPLTGLEAQSLRAPADLVMAIARRESEFDPRVVSHADARGLLQVLPGTGELTAARLGLPFDARRLTSDPIFNATLGAAYLESLISEFGALSLVAAGYNAGPGRPRRWITEFGDPRHESVDPVDWVEAIPFAETRNYVMRVLESVTLYRALLGGERRIALTPLLQGR